MRDYICKAAHMRAYWIDGQRYNFYFEYGEVYQISKLPAYAILYLEDKDVIINYTNDSFKSKFKLYEQ